MEKYIEMETFESNNCIDIKEINLFETLIKEKDIKTVFYGKRTARNNTEGECFLITIDSIFFVFTYHSKYGLYKTIEDYKNATESNYLNAVTYYSFYDQNMGKTDFNEYLLKEYQINEAIVMQYEAEHSYEKKEYFYEFIKLIKQIENIREKYNFNGNQSIIAFIILNYVTEKEDVSDKYYYGGEMYQKSKKSINPKNLIEICSSGIKIIDYDFKIKLSEKYENEYYRYIEDEDDVFANCDLFGNIIKRGHWEYDEDNFIVKIKEILFKLDVDLVVDKDVKYKSDDY